MHWIYSLMKNLCIKANLFVASLKGSFNRIVTNDDEREIDERTKIADANIIKALIFKNSANKARAELNIKTENE